METLCALVWEALLDVVHARDGMQRRVVIYKGAIHKCTFRETSHYGEEFNGH